MAFPLQRILGIKGMDGRGVNLRKGEGMCLKVLYVFIHFNLI